MDTRNAFVTQPNPELEDCKDTKENIKLIPEIGDVADVKPYCKNETFPEIKVDEITIKDEYAVALPETAAEVTEDGKPDAAPNNTTELKFTIKQEHLDLFSESENEVEQDESNMPEDNAAKPKVFKCDHCTYTGSQNRYLKSHMKRHFSKKQFECFTCGSSFFVKTDLKKHVLIHNQRKPYKCDQCEYETAIMGYLRRHQEKHKENDYKCKVCDFSCKRKISIKKHMLCHTSDRPYKCKVCDYSSVREEDLKVHVRYHTGDKPYKCKECDFACVSGSQLAVHRQLHSDTLHTCKICSYSSCYRHSFKKHMKTHTGQDIKFFKCDLCPCVVGKRSFLKKHMETHATRKRYRCDKCEFSDENISLLIVHMKTHH